MQWNCEIWYQLEEFPIFYSTILGGLWRLYLNPQHQGSVNQSVSSCDCKSWKHYLPSQDYIRLSSPKQRILETARACATQSQVLTMFELKLKIQPLFRSQRRQTKTADGFRGHSGRDTWTHVQQDTTLYNHCVITLRCTGRHNIRNLCIVTLPATSVQCISKNFL